MLKIKNNPEKKKTQKDNFWASLRLVRAPNIGLMRIFNKERRTTLSNTYVQTYNSN